MERDFQSFVTDKGRGNLYGSNPFLKAWTAIVGIVKRKFVLLRIHRYEIIFIHRELTPFGPPIFEWLISKVFRKKVVYDFDDAIWLDDGHDNSGVWTVLKWRKKVGDICTWSWKVSVGNEFLGDYARNYCDQVKLLPTVVDTEIHKPGDNRGKSDRIVIGWTGSHSTLFYLNQIIPTLSELGNSMKFEFHVISNVNPKLDLNSYRFIKWSKESEIEDLQKIDIGLMPLEDSEWANGKCGFKLIQYGAIGIPSIASPVGVNSQIIQNGFNGFLAKSPGDWKEYLNQLLTDPELRKKMGENARKNIEDNYSVKAVRTDFIELFN